MVCPWKTYIIENVQPQVNCETLTKCIYIVVYLSQVFANILLNLCKDSDQTLFFKKYLSSPGPLGVVENLRFRPLFLTSTLVLGE